MRSVFDGPRTAVPILAATGAQLNPRVARVADSSVAWSLPLESQRKRMRSGDRPGLQNRRDVGLPCVRWVRLPLASAKLPRTMLTAFGALPAHFGRDGLNFMLDLQGFPSARADASWDRSRFACLRDFRLLDRAEPLRAICVR